MMFVDELARFGIKDVCISPGSRSTPLVLAFYHHGGFKLHTIVDERSAAYFGLGIAKGCKTPVVLVCTSGTATANYFPAIIEADKNNIPLVVITADRPTKLRNTGVNQTIDQIELYGNKVRYFHDVIELESLDVDHPKIRKYSDYIRDTACKAINFSIKEYQEGPVHINFPFTKPLEPKSQDLIDQLITLCKEDNLYKGHKDNISFSEISNLTIKTNLSDLEDLVKQINESTRIIIICGPLEGDPEFAKAILELNHCLDVPIIADVLSGIRFITYQDSNLLTGINQLISAKVINSIEAPDLILHFGRNPISSAIEQYLNSLETTRKIHITGSDKWNNPIRVLDQKLQTNPIECIDYIITNFDNKFMDQNWKDSLLELNENVIQVVNNNLENGLEANLIVQIFSRIENETNVFLSNSLPIRYVDEFVYSSKVKLHVYGNRGASGIDGILSTAAGVSYGTKRSTLLIIGDLALFHDMQGLIHLQNSESKLTILVINNSGGGIFRRLPISKHEAIYDDFFNTSIELDIEGLADIFKIEYKHINDFNDISIEISQGLGTGINQMLEYKTNSIDFENYRKDLDNKINETL